MMRTIVFATNNPHKLEEVRDIVADKIRIAGLSEIGCFDEIPETADTLEGNALLKAQYVKEHYGYDCFADDTGLEIDALGGEPGVRSARYAGEDCKPADNIRKLLEALDGKTDRKARFRTVIAALLNGGEHFFEGEVKGRIIGDKRGREGFGYDPVFVPEGYGETFAEMGADVKNGISHRAIATRRFIDWLLKNSLIFVIAIMCTSVASAQNYKDWTTHLAYSEATRVADAGDRVYVLADGALYSYGKSWEEVTLYTKQNGLHDTDIRLIRYNSDTHILVAVYVNGNIDLIGDDGDVANMPQLKNTSTVRNKTVNDIYFHGSLAYLACDFGVMEVNFDKREVLNTYFLDRSITSICILGDRIYAATGSELLEASTRDNLLDRSVWKTKPLEHPSLQEGDNEILRALVFKDCLVLGIEDKGAYYETADGELKQFYVQIYIKGLECEGDELLIYTGNDLVIYPNFERFTYFNAGHINHVSSRQADGTYWIATGSDGLKGFSKGADNQYSTSVSDIHINSPKRNNNAFMTFNKERLLITGGGRSSDRLGIPGTLMTLEEGHWENFDEAKANIKISKLIGSVSRDYMGVAVDPADDNHYFVATYGEGIIEIKDGEFVELYNSRNSTLKSTFDSNGHLSYIRTGCAVFDKEGNLWTTNSLVQNALNIRKANGDWVAHYYPPLNNADKLDRIVILSNGHKWVNVPYDNAGIFVLDDNGTIDDASDDRYNFFSSFRDAQSSSGADISANEYLCMAEDRSGTMWIGTNIGLLRCGTPSRAISNPELLSCTRLVRDDEAYFLSGESVTAIAVDADNQKWIGTGSQGVFLINEDGSNTIYNFNTDNSPLLSNTINSIAINNSTGEVFFGTDKGLASFKSGVISGAKPFADVYAYPNPVRPEHSEKVTITGLSNNASVKITDLSGNLVYQGRAVGSQMVWNCRAANGARVATGIYLVIVATSDASQSVVTKIAVI
jgi:non-canonical purine NTP pyrophosphatase (RdgB/HAM1 family)